MIVKKAIIPAAGFGTRVLPASKAIPKEMLPIVDKPSIQYIVEEAAKSGITDILIIVSRHKIAIENHFDRVPELERCLLESERVKDYASIADMNNLANIYFIRQQDQRGLGHAVRMAENFVGCEPFAVLYGDDVVIGDTPAIQELGAVYDKYQKNIVGVKKVSDEMLTRTSSVKIADVLDEDNIFRISDMIEKPDLTSKFSNYAIMGRCILTPDIFDILEDAIPGANGEIQLTDAMREFALRDNMLAVEYSGTRYDMGNKFEILKANITEALRRDEFSDDLRRFLKDLKL